MRTKRAFLAGLMLCMISLVSSGSVLPKNRGNDFEEVYSSSDAHKPTISVTPAGIQTLGFSQSVTFTATVSDPDTDQVYVYWTYDDSAFTLTTNTNFTQAIFKTKSKKGTFNITAFVQDNRGLVNKATVRVIVRDYLTTPPTAPQNLRILARSYNYISLAWSAPTSGVGSVTYYHLFRRLNSPLEKYRMITPTHWAQMSYKDTDVQPSTYYQYVVIAENSGGYSQESNAYSINTLTLPAPTPSYPNLVPRAFVLPSIGNLDGNQLLLSITIQNTGSVQAGGETVQITESTDTIMSTNDRFIANISFPRLDPGQSRTETRYFNIPTAREGQYFYYFANVDAFKQVTESNEADNVAMVSVKYQTFSSPAGFRCDQVALDAIQCVSQEEFYESFSFYLLGNPNWFCDGTTTPQCRIPTPVPGVYEVQLIAWDEDTSSSEVTDPCTIVVSDEWTP